MTRTAPPAPNVCTAARVRKASRRVTQIYDRHLAPFDLTIAQFGLLAQLREVSGASVGELADRMIMDATTLSRNLRPLERRGLGNPASRVVDTATGRLAGGAAENQARRTSPGCAEIAAATANRVRIAKTATD